MKHLLKNILRNCGYEIHKLGFCTDPTHLGSGEYYPYIENYEIFGQRFKFWTVDEDVKKIYPKGAVEKDKELLALSNIIKPGERILEVGTHHGFFSTLLTKLAGQTGFLLGVEPLPKNALIAQSQISLNNIGDSCRIINVALSNKPDKLFLQRMSSNASITTNTKINTIDVTAITGDSLLKDHAPFTLIKIDVEGYEKKVLEGCKDILSSKPKIALELHVPFLKKFGTSISDIFNLIRINNYSGTMIFRQDKTKSYSFSPESIKDDDDVVNLILEPKKE